jgi:hypothetical protein
LGSGLCLVELLEQVQLPVNEVGFAVALVPRPDEIKEK